MRNQRIVFAEKVLVVTFLSEWSRFVNQCSRASFPLAVQVRLTNGPRFKYLLEFLSRTQGLSELLKLL